MAQYKVEESSLTEVADAIREKTGDAGELIFPSGFVAAIGDISGGGGFTPPVDEILTPELVYKTTRPAGWLKMPRPGDKEMYLLGLLIKGHPNQFSASIQFSGNCSVEFGTVQNGAFISKESIAISNGNRFTKSLNFENYGDETSDGYRQYMVKVSGGFSLIDLRRETKNSHQNYIVDIVCGASCEICAGGTGSIYQNVHSLQYVRYVGNGQCSFVSTKFAGCKSLRILSVENDAGVSWNSADYAFINCSSLCAVSRSSLGTNPSIGHAFYATNIKTVQVPGSPNKCNNAFALSAIIQIDPSSIDTSKSTDLSSMFNAARALRTVTGLSLESATNVSSIFQECFSLSRITFAGETTPGGWTISLTDTCLGHDALVSMIASLPTAMAAATITITGVPGASALTDAEIAVATAKNWTITR